MKILIWLMLILNSSWLYAYKSVTIKQETSQFTLSISYPQGFKSDAVNRDIQKFVLKAKEEFLSQMAAEKQASSQMCTMNEASNCLDNVSAKSSFNVTYSIPYKSKNALSIRFNLSTYHQGAAHPINVVDIENYFKNRPIQLHDLFVSQSNYLNHLSATSEKTLRANKSLNSKWIKKGTKPEPNNYRIWHFSKNGIVIVFDTYQVAPYVYGPQTVAVPMNNITPLLKPQIIHEVWGS